MSELNPLNDLSRIYLDKVALMNRQEEQNDVERCEGILDDQMEKSSKELATLGAPTMEEEKKAAKDYDGDGKVESGKDEYFGSKDKAIKKAMKKEDTDNYVEAYVDVLRKTSLGSYVSEEYDELDNELLEIVENTLGNLAEDEILDMMESMYHRRNPGKKHPLESGSSKVKRRPVSDQEKKSTDKTDRMYVAMRRVTDKPISKSKSDAAGRLYDRYSTRQGKRKAGASSKEASAQSFGEFGGKDFAIKRGGRKGKAPATDRGRGNKAARKAGQEVKDRDPRKKS